MILSPTFPWFMSPQKPPRGIKGILCTVHIRTSPFLPSQWILDCTVTNAACWIVFYKLCAQAQDLGRARTCFPTKVAGLLVDTSQIKVGVRLSADMSIKKTSWAQFVVKPVHILTELASSFGFVRECLCRGRVLCKAMRTGIYKLRWNEIYFYLGRWSCPVSAQQHGSSRIGHTCRWYSWGATLPLLALKMHHWNVYLINLLILSTTWIT